MARVEYIGLNNTYTTLCIIEIRFKYMRNWHLIFWKLGGIYKERMRC